jgi:hypothetical protein
MRFPARVAVWMLILGFAVCLQAQTVIDTRRPARIGSRVPLSGSGGSIGRKLPIKLEVLFQSAPGDDGRVDVEFVLTNTGKQSIVIPLSVDSADFESSDRERSYTVDHLSLYITAGKDHQQILGGGANLYGNDQHPGSAKALAPGETIRVLGRANIPNLSDGVFVAHAVLNRENIRVDDKDSVRQESQQIGAAISHEYSAKDIPKK